MSDLIDKQREAAVAVFVVMYWAAVFALPFLIMVPGVTHSVWIWGLIACLIGYFVYTGYRAWKRRWMARFVLRIVIPAVLFVGAWVIVALAF